MLRPVGYVSTDAGPLLHYPCGCDSGQRQCAWVRRVQVTVIDKTGHRFPVRGLEGQTLVEVLGNQDALDVHDCASRYSACAVSHLRDF